MKRQLSPRQQRMLEFIRDFMDEHHFPPTVRDIQAGCEISSTSVVDYNLQILQREGYMRRLPEVSRGIELLDGTPRGATRDIVRIPVLGYIAAGEPLPIPTPDSWHQEELENIDLPFLVADTWKLVTLAITDNTDMTAIKCVGLNVAKDNGLQTVNLDQIVGQGQATSIVITL